MLRRLLLAFLPSVSLVSACECEPAPFCARLQSPVMFIGKVVAGGVSSIRDDPWYKDSGSVRFAVVEAFRGLAPGTKFVDIETSLLPGMCSPNPYFPGRTYLVPPHSRDGKLWDGICFSGRDIEYASDLVDYIRQRVRNPQQIQIRGRVAAVKQKDIGPIDFLTRNGAKPLQGVTVSSTSGKGATVSTKTDAQGRYVLTLESPGKHSVKALLPPYTPSTMQTDLGAKGVCAVVDFGLISKSSISGRVLSRWGRPLAQSRVGLIDLDRPADERFDPSAIRAVYAKESDGSFQFDDVPIGKYLLVFNPEGPKSGRSWEVPNESTYYPNGTGRSRAQAIEINKPGMRVTGKDVIAGPPAVFRAVSVRARFPDGSTMTDGFVAITGDPIEPDGIPWRETAFIGKKEPIAHLQVPVNRKFRISVRDGYGRDLKKTYESTHLPASTPVQQEFTITIPQ